jgi:hypothetical protein
VGSNFHRDGHSNVTFAYIMDIDPLNVNFVLNNSWNVALFTAIYVQRNALAHAYVRSRDVIKCLSRKLASVITCRCIMSLSTPNIEKS